MTNIGIVLNGVTGRMGYHQHLVRSIMALRSEGGVELSDGSKVQVEPLLVGRDESRLEAIAERHGLSQWTTDLDGALADSDYQVYFDATLTATRRQHLAKAIEAGRHVYTEKPVADTFSEAVELLRLAQEADITTGVVHDKLYLPGFRQLRRLIQSGFFGRILSVRGEFGYWVFEGDTIPAQRPSWNYRVEDGGGITQDMLCHWSYILEEFFGPVEAVTAKATTHIPARWDETGVEYEATADDASYAIVEIAGGIIAQINSSWAVRVHRDELVEFQVDGTLGSAVVGLHKCVIQPRAASPMPRWNPDVPDETDYRAQWQSVPANDIGGNGFKLQWEEYLRDVVQGNAHRYDFASGARGVLLAESALESSKHGRRIALGEVKT